MKFAVNYSDPLVRLLEEQAVEVDLIKCPDWEGMVEEAKPYSPITIHYDLQVGLAQTFEVDFSRIERFKTQTGTPYVNTHLVTPRTFDADDRSEVTKINQLWRDEIQLMIDHFGADSVVLEHFPYTTSMPHIAMAADPEIFSQVILDTDCMLLLDLAHARITADTLGMDTKDYIQSLPLDRLVEMHITGIKQHGGVLTDHFGLSEGDLEILAWALESIRAGKWREPQIVAFEYGGVGDVFIWRTDYDVLKSQVPKLFRMVHNV